ncbi:hypothetical protein M378DRAFT_17783 [Amanita muscaria Koide BX008]|uniref:CCHC-type domain-containing protein n=1 Tax=Amanita muscaria (strain Koide BX008) TaxID=946122 RepID=A0A0C2WHM4_AMAMK|nr:hypothetical protein M378DRAFT_17783 [Amanita muscaria Koide BX008]
MDSFSWIWGGLGIHKESTGNLLGIQGVHKDSTRKGGGVQILDPTNQRKTTDESVEHNQKFYWEKHEPYFDQSTDRWRLVEGNQPAPDWFFEEDYTPGDPDTHVPEELRTPPTPVAGPSNPELVQTRPSFSANIESSDEEGNTSGTSEEFVNADQSAELEYVEQEQPEETEQDQDESKPSPPEADVEMSTAGGPAPNTDQEGGGGFVKLPFPTKFNGKRHKSASFIVTCDAFFIFYPKQFNEDPQKIAFTLLLLEGNASTWRDTELKKLPLKTEGTWVQFKERFSKQWDEVNSEGVALNAIKRLKLTSSFKMDRLTARFNELIPYCKLDDNPFMQIEFFVNTLTPEIQKHVLLQNPKTYEEARQAAVQCGIANDRMDISAGRKPRFGVSGFNHSSSSHKDPYAMDVDAIDLEEEGTNICLTKLSPSQIEEYKNQGKCFNCSQRGHMSRYCPNKKNNRNKGKRPQRGNGNWRKGKPSGSTSIRSAETDDEPAEEEKEEGDIMRIRAMIANLSTEERSELLGKDFQ